MLVTVLVSMFDITHVQLQQGGATVEPGSEEEEQRQTDEIENKKRDSKRKERSVEGEDGRDGGEGMWQV